MIIILSPKPMCEFQVIQVYPNPCKRDHHLKRTHRLWGFFGNCLYSSFFKTLLAEFDIHHRLESCVNHQPCSQQNQQKDGSVILCLLNLKYSQQVSNPFASQSQLSTTTLLQECPRRKNDDGTCLGQSRETFFSIFHKMVGGCLFCLCTSALLAYYSPKAKTHKKYLLPSRPPPSFKCWLKLLRFSTSNRPYC